MVSLVPGDIKVTLFMETSIVREEDKKKERKKEREQKIKGGNDGRQEKNLIREELMRGKTRIRKRKEENTREYCEYRKKKGKRIVWRIIRLLN